MTSLSADDLASLVEVGRELASETDMAVLLRRILERATELTSSTDSSVILFDERRRILYFADATGADAAGLLERWGRASERGISVQGSVAGQVFATGRPTVVQAVREDPEHFGEVDRDTGHATRSMICVPLAAAGARLGVVQLLNKTTGDYTERDLALLEHFAAQAAVALRNARLVEDLLDHMGFYTTRGAGLGPQEILAEISRPAHAEVLSILFADMRGSTQLWHVENRPERVQQMVSEFLGELADAVLGQRGIVNRFLGDGLMALFAGEDHALRAVRCAGAMQERFLALRARWDDASNVDLGFLDLGIGIATDSVILGPIGTDRVRDYTALGSAVNLAAHLMNHARDGRRVLVDKITFRAAQAAIGEFEGPESFQFKKPGQEVGHPYERYWVKSLAGGAAFGSRAPAASPAAGQRAAEGGLFISYAHADKPWLERLQVHLQPYVRRGLVRPWSDTRIRPGERWREEIEKALAEARIALLLVSPSFLDSRFIAEKELPPLLAAAERKGLVILWVALSASSYDETEIGGYQAVLDPAHPLDALSPAEQNEALVRVCKAIKEAGGA